MGLARDSAREAVKSLQSLGIIEVRLGYGLFVSPYDFGRWQPPWSFS
jgi:DNA-binding FadR family transcriptional regulator